MVYGSIVSTHRSSQPATSNMGPRSSIVNMNSATSSSEPKGGTSSTDAIHKLNALKMFLLACIPASSFNPSGNAMMSASGSAFPVYSSTVNAAPTLRPSVLYERDGVRGVPAIGMATEFTLEDLQKIAAWKPPTESKANGEDKADGEDLSSLTVQELKDRLKAAGLKVSGNKAQLIARLEEHTKESEVSQKEAKLEEEEPLDKRADSKASYDSERHYEGTVLSFNDVRHFGFIDCKELHEEGILSKDSEGLFFHRKDVVGGLSLWMGDPVKFTIGTNDDGKLEALSVEMMSASEAAVQVADLPPGAAEEIAALGAELSGIDAGSDSSEEIAALRAELSGMQEDLQSLTVNDLKAKLKAAGLKTSGKKAELIERLEQHAAEQQDSQAAAATSHLAKASARQTARVSEGSGRGSAPQIQQYFDGHPMDFKPEDLTVVDLLSVVSEMLHFYKKQTSPDSPEVDLAGDAYDLMAYVFSKHPSAAEKIGPGLRRIFVAIAKDHPSPCFHFERTDGVIDDISYRKCLGWAPGQNWEDWTKVAAST